MFVVIPSTGGLVSGVVVVIEGTRDDVSDTAEDYKICAENDSLINKLPTP